MGATWENLKIAIKKKKKKKKKGLASNFAYVTSPTHGEPCYTENRLGKTRVNMTCRYGYVWTQVQQGVDKEQ